MIEFNLKFFNELINEDKFTVKDITKMIYIQCMIIILMTIYFNIDLWYRMLVIDEDTSIELVVVNVLMFIGWMFVELQYYSLQQLKNHKE